MAHYNTIKNEICNGTSNKPITPATSPRGYSMHAIEKSIGIRTTKPAYTILKPCLKPQTSLPEKESKAKIN